MVQKKTVWMAEIDGELEECSTKREAVEKEKDFHIIEEIEELTNTFRKYFRTHYNNKDQYSNFHYLCVDCGKTLLHYDTYWDGHRNERGKVLTSDPDRKLFMDGLRCSSCHSKIFKLLEKIFEFYTQANSSHSLSLLDLSCWERVLHWPPQPRELCVELFKMVDFWDCNKEGKEKIKKK